MPDITMCMDHACPQALNSNCYRYVAIAGTWQSYFAGRIRMPDADSCEMYVGVQEGPERRYMRGPDEAPILGA